jgi:uncharacterized protein
MARSFLILHGIENHRPPAHWQFQLAARLADQGHQVLYPGLPDPDAPSYAAWRRQLRSLLGEMAGDERVVICHSLSCLLWLRAAGDPESATPVDRLLLVSPPLSEKVPAAGAGFRLDDFDAEAVIAGVGSPIRIACSDDDPYNPVGAGPLYGSRLDAQVDVIVGGGHITPDEGYGRWPSVEAWCDDPAVTLEPAHASASPAKRP